MTASNLTQAFGSPWYGNVWLTLATIAYTDDASDQIVNVTGDLPARVQQMAAMPAMEDGTELPPGQWSVGWGPVYTTNLLSFNANLMYVAVYTTSDGPLFAAVCIRGTDTSELYTPGGLCTQLLQDLDVGHMVAWPDVLANNPNPALLNAAPGLQAAIAHGTANAMADLLSFTWPQKSGVTVVDYLTTLPAKTPIVVTGHSLGGCLATVMAPYLANAFALNEYPIIPHPFAPPSAGNQAWCALYQSAFPMGTGQVWWNTADIVPNAFQVVANNPPVTTSSMTNISNMWGQNYNGDVPIGKYNDVVTHYENVANGAYTHLINDLGTGFVQTLNGSYLLPVSSDPASKSCSNDWLTQLTLQHFQPMYFYLIKNQLSIPQYLPPPLPNPPPTCTIPNGGNSTAGAGRR